VPRIRLAPSATIASTEIGVLLRSDLGTFQLQGADFRVFASAIVPLLDGSRDREAVADVLGQFSHKSVLAFLDLLERHGLVEPVPDESGDERWRGQNTFFRKWTDQHEEAAKRIRTARVVIVGLESWGVVAAVELAASGIGALHLLDDGRVAPDDLLSIRIWGSQHLGQPRARALEEVLAKTSPWCAVTFGSLPLGDASDLTPHDTQWDLVIGALAGDELRLLRCLARFAHGRNMQSLFGYLDGLDAVVGPAVVPGQTACWNCARLRQLANVDHPEAAHSLQVSLLSERPMPRSRTYLAPMAPLLGHLLALETLKIISRYTTSHLTGRLLVQNLVTLETSLHTVIRMPWCDICGGAGGDHTPSGGPWFAASTTIQGSGAQRQSLTALSGAGELRELLAGWVDSRTGVIRQLAIGTPEAIQPEVPVTSAAVLASYTEGMYIPSEPMIGSGKGLTALDAMVGAVGEAIERYSASRYRKTDLHRSALNDLEGDFLDPRWLCLYDDAQYERPHFPFARFDPARPIEWTAGRWLDTGTPVWAPALMTYFEFHANRAERFCQVTSNGLAAGAAPEDAALRAVLELIERDAFMITWLAHRPGRRLYLDETLDPGAHEVVRQLAERGVEVELFLLDAGLSIPSIICLGIGDGERWPGVTVALAAHLNPRIAARKAILEQGHTGPYLAKLMLGRERPIPAAPEEVHTLLDHALYYAPADRVRIFDFLREHGDNPISLAGLPVPPDASLATCIECLRAGGARVAIADVTSPDVSGSPFRVARALGIGMQPIDFGFGLQRLPTPRLLSMLNRRSALNRHPHPFA
jgi:ribosomal protein S12 methylthiotransferase accessory factor